MRRLRRGRKGEWRRSGCNTSELYDIGLLGCVHTNTGLSNIDVTVNVEGKAIKQLTYHLDIANASAIDVLRLYQSSVND